MRLNQLIIGDIDIYPPVVLAPMAGIANLPYRIICSMFGAGLVYTELVSSEAITRKNVKTEILLKTYQSPSPSSSPQRGEESSLQNSSSSSPLWEEETGTQGLSFPSPLWGEGKGEGKTGVQLFGARPDVMADAAQKISEYGALLIDINMGCPVKKVITSGAGAALLKEPAKAEKIINAVVKAVNIPVTVKIRTGWDGKNINALEISKIAEECGAKAVTVHGRNAVQGFSGKADWEIISKVKQNLSIPVIGNGDVSSPEDAKRMFESTECDAVMIGRGAFGRPWIFSHIVSYLEKVEIPHSPSSSEIKTIMLEHFRLNIETFGERQGVNLFKNHASWYCRGMRGAIEFRKNVNTTSTADEMIKLIEGLFQGYTEKNP